MNELHLLKKELYKSVTQTHLTIQKKQFYLQLPKLVNQLAEQVVTQTYQPSVYTCFAINDNTPREILAPHYKDRIVHRWLINQLEPFIDKRLLPCSYANRKGKGHHKAVTKVRQLLHNPTIKYYLQLDIQSFFNKINHQILLNHVYRWIDKTAHTNTVKAQLKHVCEVIIKHNPTTDCIFTGNKENLKTIPSSKSYFSNPTGVGLPLGNLSSQFFANIYLHELDFFVKHKLAIPYYIRYVDDIVVLAENPAQLKNWHYQIEQFLNNNLQLTIHPQKTILQPTSQGLDFLGYIIRKNYVLVRKKVVRNFKRKLYFFNHPSSKWRTVFAKSFVSSINSYLGIFSFADSYQLRKKSYLCYLKIMQKGTYASNKFKKIKQYKCNL